MSWTAFFKLMRGAAAFGVTQPPGPTPASGGIRSLTAEPGQTNYQSQYLRLSYQRMKLPIIFT